MANALTISDLQLRAGELQASVFPERADAHIPILEIVVGNRIIGFPTIEPPREAGAPHTLRAALPADALNDGAQILLIRQEGEPAALAQLTLLIGAEPDANLVAEVALLRAELELLKKAFRRQNAMSGF